MWHTQACERAKVGKWNVRRQANIAIIAGWPEKGKQRFGNSRIDCPAVAVVRYQHAAYCLHTRHPGCDYCFAATKLVSRIAAACLCLWLLRAGGLLRAE
jgi:hypothetical protein